MIVNPMIKNFTGKESISQAKYMRLINLIFALFVSFWPIDMKLL
jgi:hypothetical protein